MKSKALSPSSGFTPKRVFPSKDINTGLRFEIEKLKKELEETEDLAEQWKGHALWYKAKLEEAKERLREALDGSL